MRIEIEMLEDHPDALANVSDAPGTGVDLFSLEADLAALDIFEAVDTSQQGRLSRAARPDEADDFTWRDNDVDAVQNRAVAEFLTTPDISTMGEVGTDCMNALLVLGLDLEAAFERAAAKRDRVIDDEIESCDANERQETAVERFPHQQAGLRQFDIADDRRE